ncbi:hypothetical protein L2089_13675 [Paenibacillus hunanensis]|uniref:hypothetical protein n=1 Tax=Paenibacillus hunanensis TaxID=539262 RepID=UPI002025D732|nr:hypothetical protein [Paenibacillus hunanensis]MCL9661745.1 hypothetical protein [Paenibacillus hunanensis]
MKYWLLRRPFTPVAAIPAATAFARQLADRHQPRGAIPGIPAASLIHRRPAAREAVSQQEIHHHHHQRIEWKPRTSVSITQPLLIRNYYFWRLLTMEGRGQPPTLPWSESERSLPSMANGDAYLAISGNAGHPHPALLRMLMSGDTGRLPPSIWLEAHVEQEGAGEQVVPLSLRMLGSLPQLIFRQLSGSLGGMLTSGQAGNTAMIQPYEWTLDTSALEQGAASSSWSSRKVRELSRLVPLIERSGSRGASIRSGMLSERAGIHAPQLRWLTPVRLTIPVRRLPSDSRPDGERNIRRLSDLFHVSRLSELDRVLGGTYTVQLMNVLPSPEQTAAALPYPSWQPLRQEPTRDPEDWLYHIVRLFNPHERRAVIEHNIRRLYQRAAERSFHQQAGRWSRMVMTAVRQEWRRQSPAGAPVAGMPEQLIRRQGNRWLWNQSALAGGMQWRQASQRLREWWPWLNLPWLQPDSGDDALRRELYHPLLLRRYLNEDEAAGSGADIDSRWLQGNIYETLGRYIERETLRLSPERFMMLLPLAAALPGQSQRTSLRQFARERTAQQLGWSNAAMPSLFSIPATMSGISRNSSSGGVVSIISTLVQRMTGRELSRELLRTRSFGSELTTRLIQQTSMTTERRSGASDAQLEASRWLMRAVQADPLSSAMPLQAESGRLPERLLLAFRRSNSHAGTESSLDNASAYAIDNRGTSKIGTPLMAGMGLPLNGPAEPAMLELLRRRIRQLPQQMLTGEQGHTELDVATNGSQQEPFVPEWRRTRPAVAPASAEAEANGNAGMGSAGTTTGSLNTVLSDPNASPSARQPVRLGPNEMEQIVQRVYRELQRRLKSDYQRRGM